MTIDPAELRAIEERAWNTCTECGSLLEKPGGDVEFFEGDTVECPDCECPHEVYEHADDGLCVAAIDDDVYRLRKEVKALRAEVRRLEGVLALDRECRLLNEAELHRADALVGAATQRAERAEALVRRIADLSDGEAVVLARDFLCDATPAAGICADCDGRGEVESGSIGPEPVVHVETCPCGACSGTGRATPAAGCAVCGDDGTNSWKCLHCPKAPNEIDLDGHVDERGIVYVGKALRQPGGVWLCLANVDDALCRVEVRITAIRKPK